jgi:hypothetical protein
VAPFAALQTPTMAQHPALRDTLYVASYGPGQSGIFVTRDGGASFSSVRALSDNEFTHSIAISAANPQRIYAAGIAFDASSMTHYLLRSPDGGTTWERSTIELASSDERASVVSVHPSNENEVLLKTTAFIPDAGTERLLLSRDGGATFTSVFVGTRLSDAGYGPGGGDVWVADAAGLWRSTDGLQNFARHGDARWMSCVEHHDGRLWACGQFAGIAANKDGVGVAARPEDPLFPWMDFKDVVEPAACGPDAATSLACQAAWAHWQVEVLGGNDGGVPGDAGYAGYGGASDGGGNGGSGGENPQASDDSGGCTFGAARANSSSRLGVLLIAALCAWLARSAQRRVAEISRPSGEKPDPTFS